MSKQPPANEAKFPVLYQKEAFSLDFLRYISRLGQFGFVMFLILNALLCTAILLVHIPSEILLICNAVFFVNLAIHLAECKHSSLCLAIQGMVILSTLGLISMLISSNLYEWIFKASFAGMTICYFSCVITSRLEQKRPLEQAEPNATPAIDPAS